MLNEWALEALRERGIKVFADGSLEVQFFKGNISKVPDVATAIRQQQHIVDQQREEQEENKEIGILMRQFHELVMSLVNMSIEVWRATEDKRIDYLSKLTEILKIMETKKEELRRDGYDRLVKVYKMLEKGNIPAANLASQAALDRMRKRWLVNEKVIDKSFARLEALKSLSN